MLYTYGGGIYQNNPGTGLCRFNFSEQTSIGITFQNKYALITGNSIYFTKPTNQCTSELQVLGINISMVSSPTIIKFTNDFVILLLGQNVILNASVTDSFGNPVNVCVYMLLHPWNTPYTLKGVYAFTIQNGMTSASAYITGQNQASGKYNFHFVPFTALDGHIADIY